MTTYVILVGVLAAFGAAAVLSGLVLLFQHRRRWCPAVAGAVILGLMVTVAQPALAIVPPPTVSYVRGYHNYVDTYGHCIYTSANPGMGMSTAHGSGHPRMDSFTSIDWYNGSQCGNTNAGWAAYSYYIRQDLVIMHGPYGYTCNQGPNVWNPYWQHAVSTWWAAPSAPCGAGYYYERIYSYDYLGNGSASYSNPNVWVY